MRGVAILVAVMAALSYSGAGQAAACGADKLGTSRTIMLERGAGGAFGTAQHTALPGLARGEVVLTFDDGPVAMLTPKVLDALKAECARATFFMKGENIDANPDLAHRAVADGHSAGLHSYAHPHLGTLSEAAQMDDLARGQAAYRKVFGVLPASFRFPFLEETPLLMATLAKQGVAIFSIDMAITDWQPEDTTAILADRLGKALDEKGGGIIVMHDVNPPTAEAITALLRVLKDKGYKVVHLEWRG